MQAPPSDDRLVETLSGLVVESLAIKQNFTDGTVGCRACDGTRLREGDSVTVAVSCYEGHSWEIQGVYCAEHDIDDVEDVMETRAETQAVVAAVLQRDRYQSARGDVEPDALVLAAVEVLDVSPAGDAY
ncbi:hypothetical protein [Halovenus marina]|uniref:hypothetical protein n=1 Tax=Halovenus marina TaxID=3396621 RepID=UPI003F556E40